MKLNSKEIDILANSLAIEIKHRKNNMSNYKECQSIDKEIIRERLKLLNKLNKELGVNQHA